MMDGAWPEKMQPYMDTLSEEKQKGRIQSVGVSCHTLPALKAAAVTPWVDVILSRVNPKGVLMDGTTDEVVSVLRQAKGSGKAIIGMKIFGEGRLVSERAACLQFAQNLDCLDAMTIGFDTPAQIDDVLQLMARFPAAHTPVP
jgi:predicted aldo/keto reductase-like oxidoreductase